MRYKKAHFMFACVGM